MSAATVTREERDLLVRWARDLRREAPHAPLRTAERIYRRMRALNPRALPSAPSPRQSIAA